MTVSEALPRECPLGCSAQICSMKLFSTAESACTSPPRDSVSQKDALGPLGSLARETGADRQRSFF